MNALNELANLIFYVSYCATICMEIFLPCYFGTELMLKNNNLTTAAYTSNWTEFPMNIQKMVVVFMEFLKQPKVLLSGKVFTLSLNSFLVVKFSFSLYGKTPQLIYALYTLQVLNRTYSLFAVLKNLLK